MKKDEISICHKDQATVSKGAYGFLVETAIGLSFYAFWAAIVIGIYIGIFGYGLGHIFYYAFNTTISMPISYDTCFAWGLIPILNLLGFLIAAYIIFFQFLIFIGGKVLLWLMTWLPEFLKAWASNLGR